MEEKPRLEILGYIGGQDEDLGGYCEPLIIRVEGSEHYILHEMHTYRDPDDLNQETGFAKIKAHHSKVEFSRLEDLIAAFNKVKEKLKIDKGLPWVETDLNCGYEIPSDVWEQARNSFYN